MRYTNRKFKFYKKRRKCNIVLKKEEGTDIIHYDICIDHLVIPVELRSHILSTRVYTLMLQGIE